MENRLKRKLAADELTFCLGSTKRVRRTSR
jgi:hypothetical protein